MKRKLFSIALILSTSLGLVHGDGAIQLANNTLTRVRMLWSGGSYINVPAAAPVVYGLFIVPSSGCPILILPLGIASTTTEGLINAPSPYVIPGTGEGQEVSLQVKGWAAEFGTNWCAAMRRRFDLFGETGVRRIVLGGTTNPAVIWATGASPDRFDPLSIGLLSLPPVYLEVNDITATEGSSGVINAVFSVSRRYDWLPYTCCTNYPEAEPFATTNGTALAQQDYVATNGIVRFEPGQSSTTIFVTLLADTAPEPDETFSLALRGLYYSPYDKPVGTCTITEARVIEAQVIGADVAVTFHTVAGRHYAVESSPDCASWVVVTDASDVTGAGGSMTIRDAGAGLTEKRFYRLRLL